MDRLEEFISIVVGALGMGLTFFVVACLYFLPTIIATKRKHHNSAPICIINIFLGWTFLGWVIALGWAFSKPSVVIVTEKPHG